MGLSLGAGNGKDGIGDENGVVLGSSIDCTEKELVERKLGQRPKVSCC